MRLALALGSTSAGAEGDLLRKSWALHSDATIQPDSLGTKAARRRSMALRVWQRHRVDVNVLLHEKACCSLPSDSTEVINALHWPGAAFAIAPRFSPSPLQVADLPIESSTSRESGAMNVSTLVSEELVVRAKLHSINGYHHGASRREVGLGLVRSSIVVWKHCGGGVRGWTGLG